MTEKVNIHTELQIIDAIGAANLHRKQARESVIAHGKCLEDISKLVKALPKPVRTLWGEIVLERLED